MNYANEIKGSNKTVMEMPSDATDPRMVFEAITKALDAQKRSFDLAQKRSFDLTQKRLDVMYKAYQQQVTVSEERAELIKELNDKIRSTRTTTTQRDYQELNIKYNELLTENQQLKEEIEQLKLRKRQPLKETHPAILNNSTTIQDMLKNTPRPKSNFATPKPTTTSRKHSTSSSHNNSQSDESELIPTQFTYQPHEQDENAIDHEEQTQEETFFVPDELTRRTRRRSLDLGAADVNIPSSLPYQETIEVHSQSTDVESSPTKVKKEEEEYTESQEIKDSQYNSDNELPISLPTPKTVSKTQTPANKKFAQQKNLKRSLINFETPTDITPFKKHRHVKEEPTPTQLPRIKQERPTELPLRHELSQPTQLTQSTERLNLSTHPFKNREWLPEDFRINAKLNNNIPYAYHVVLRGAARKCVHGTTCHDCDKFYAAMGDLPDNYNGPRWDSSRPKFDVVKSTSRHRDQWGNAPEPAGFAEFDFPNTQQQMENKRKGKEMKLTQAYERLYSALNDQKYLFKEERFNEAVITKEFEVDELVFLKHLNKVQDK